MNKVTDYSVIIFREDGTIDYETVHVTDKYNYVLFLDKNVNVRNDNLYNYDFSIYKDILNADMCIGMNGDVLKCRWLCKPSLLLWTNERGHYNFYCEEVDYFESKNS